MGSWLKTGVALLAGLLANVCCMPVRAESAEVQLAWTSPVTNEDGSSLTNLVGFKLYCGESSGAYTTCMDLGAISSVTVSNLQEGQTYYFSVTARSDQGMESDFSEELAFTVEEDTGGPTGPTPPAYRPELTWLDLLLTGDQSNSIDNS